MGIIEGAGTLTAGPGLTKRYVEGQSSMQLRFKRLSSDATLSKRAHPTDAGLDLHAYLPNGNVLHLASQARLTVPTGVAVAIPDGYVGMVCPRSGLAAKNGLTVTNAPGIIDSGYRGELLVILQNTSNKPFNISNGDRIAQLVVVPALHLDVTEVAELPEADRGDNGFGSTGL